MRTFRKRPSVAYLIETFSDVSYFKDMKVNSENSLKTASKSFAKHGHSWTAVRKSAKRVNGVLVIEREKGQSKPTAVA